MELEAFNIRFKHVSGKANILADMLSHLIDLDPDARLDPENTRWEFGYYICRATTRPPRSSSTAECLRLIARPKRGTGIYGLLGTSATV